MRSGCLEKLTGLPMSEKASNDRAGSGGPVWMSQAQPVHPLEFQWWIEGGDHPGREAAFPISRVSPPPCVAPTLVKYSSHPSFQVVTDSRGDRSVVWARRVKQRHSSPSLW
ncbi:hypothetical protein NDU88_005544 [Pleurodeles waltl]|uniref:Uncharacterized protein n=1 Tax=Pleurodeles waltl TaxID=8319 RepID=A0AAV7QF29_PLEWA|nr:hypothetical protein NDU88_005544 [Pleurodeles waltl]